MRLPAVALTAAVFLSGAMSAAAQTADPGKVPGIHLYGAGSQSCGTWLADRNNVAIHNFELQWVLGWLSASNVYLGMSGGRLRETDANAIAAWVDKYCRENPFKNITDASLVLVNELLKPE